MVRFLQLLEIGEQRRTVSTNKLTSKISENANQALVDKLSLGLYAPLSREELIARLSQTGTPHRPSRLKQGWYFEIGKPGSGLFFPNKEMISKVVSRPSAFESWTEYLSALRNVLSTEELATARITRLDLSLDYSVSINKMLESLDIAQKQVLTQYRAKSGVRTGALIGQGNEKLLVYDKATESNIPGPLCRIELQLAGAKLPTRSLLQLPDILLAEPEGKMLSQVSLSNVCVKTVEHGLTSAQETRASQLRSLLEREGLLATRHALNQQGNFDRDYRPLLEIEPWSEQPQVAFRRLIRSFLVSEIASQQESSPEGLGEL